MLRFGVLPSVEAACEECCRCMQRCWFPQTLPTRQPSGVVACRDAGFHKRYQRGSL